MPQSHENTKLCSLPDCSRGSPPLLFPFHLTGLQSRADLDKKIGEQSRHIKSLQQELLHLRRLHAKKENVLNNVREEIRDFVHGKVSVLSLSEDDFGFWLYAAPGHFVMFDEAHLPSRWGTARSVLVCHPLGPDSPPTPSSFHSQRQLAPWNEAH
jgi:hypothetical protein